METPFQVNRIFIGYDPRQAVAFNVLAHSIMARATCPVSIEPLMIQTLPIDRTGLTPFTFSRFLVPWICRYEGHALFLDADMLCLGDVAEIFAAADPKYAVQVVKVKERFEWASMILFNCGHPDNAKLDPELIQNSSRLAFHKLGWLLDEQIGDLPSEWNHTVLYDEPREDAKLVHFTGGIPLHPETRGCEYTQEWFEEARDMNSTWPWQPLMGHSVHATKVMQHRIRMETECADEKPTP